LSADISVDGETLTTDPPTASFDLRAKQHFYLRIQGGELRTSLDGKSFDVKPSAPGAFRIAFETAAPKGARLTAHITTPTHARR
jgi:hypothetical protein